MPKIVYSVVPCLLPFCSLFNELLTDSINVKIIPTQSLALALDSSSITVVF
jgi:hypothetical protein